MFKDFGNLELAKKFFVHMPAKAAEGDHLVYTV